MKYKDIEIHNFRGIKHLKIDNCGLINLFVGKNNASKTSILESLFTLAGSLSPEIIVRINLFRDLGFNEQEDLRLIFHNLKFTENIHIKAIGFKEERRELEISPSSSDEKGRTLTKNLLRDNNDFNSSYSSSIINELTLKTTIKERHSAEKKVSGKLIFNGGEFKSENAFVKGYDNDRAVFVRQNLNLSQNLEKELENLIITKQYTEIVDVLKQVDPTIKNLTLGHNRMLYVDNDLDRLIPINLLGDGIRRLLGVILAIYNSRNGIVLIDEIDNGLHFSALKSLWKSIIYTANKSNVQVFVSTHNYETIKYLTECLEEEEFEKYQDQVKTFTIRKLENGEHKSYGYDYSQFKNAIIEEIEMR